MKQDASARERKIRRILHLQRQLHRLSQWRLSELQGQEAAIQDKQRDLIGALNDANAAVRALPGRPDPQALGQQLLAGADALERNYH